MSEQIHKDNLEDFFRKSLENFGDEPSGDLWDKIEGGIPPKPRSNIGQRATWLAAALLVGLVLTWGGYTFYQATDKVDSLSDTVAKQAEMIETLQNKVDGLHDMDDLNRGEGEAGRVGEGTKNEIRKDKTNDLKNEQGLEKGEVDIRNRKATGLEIDTEALSAGVKAINKDVKNTETETAHPQNGTAFQKTAKNEKSNDLTRPIQDGNRLTDRLPNSEDAHFKKNSLAKISSHPNINPNKQGGRKQTGEHFSTKNKGTVKGTEVDTKNSDVFIPLSNVQVIEDNSLSILRPASSKGGTKQEEGKHLQTDFYRLPSQESNAEIQLNTPKPLPQKLLAISIEAINWTGDIEEALPAKKMPLAKVPMPTLPSNKESGWSVGIVATPMYSYRKLVGKKDKKCVNKLNEQESGAISMQAGVELAYQWNKKWRLSSGMVYKTINQRATRVERVRYTEMGAEVSDNELSNNYKIEVETAYGRTDYDVRLTHERQFDGQDLAEGDSLQLSLDTKQQLQYISVPLAADYGVEFGKFRFTVRGGIATNFKVRSSNELKRLPPPNSRVRHNDMPPNSGGNPPPVGGPPPPKKNKHLKAVNLDVLAGVGMHYQANRQWSIGFEPTYQRAVTPVFEDKKIKVYPYSFGGQLGVRYRF